MKRLSLLVGLILVATLQAEPSLKKEVLAHLKPVIESSEEAPPGMTPERFYRMLSEDAEFSLTAAQQKVLAGGKTLHTAAERATLLKQVEALQAIPGAVDQSVLVKVLQSEDVTPRSREAAYRLLAQFNQQKVLRLGMENTQRCKLLVLRKLMGEESADRNGMKKPEELRFLSVDGELDWLRKPAGFGDLSKIRDNGSKVIVMAPRVVDGKVIVGCDNGSVQNRALEELKGVLDLTLVKGQEAQ